VEDKKEYRKRLGKIEYAGKQLEVDKEVVEKKIRETLRELEKEGNKGKEKKKGWWDKECAEKKKEVWELKK
jgi:hypothetical protein